jgi:hypothetical protein
MSTLTVTNIKKTGETASRDVSGVAAAWVNFNGTGTVSIEESFNAASITDLGTGTYRTTFTTSFTTTRHSTTGGCGGYPSSFDSFVSFDPASSSASYQSIWCLDRDNGPEDQDVVSLHSMGDLA